MLNIGNKKKNLQGLKINIELLEKNSISKSEYYKDMTYQVLIYKEKNMCFINMYNVAKSIL